MKCNSTWSYPTLTFIPGTSTTDLFFFMRGGSYFNFKAPRLVLLKRMGLCGRKVGHVASNKYSKLSQQRSVSTALLR